MIEWFEFDPLEQVSENVFKFPDRGLYDGERLIFTRAQTGLATQVEAASVVFKRRTVGPEEGAAQLRIKPLRPIGELLKEALAAKPPKEAGEFREPDLVELNRLDPTIKLEVRYATTNNFVGKAVYPEARAFLQRPAAEALGAELRHRLHVEGDRAEIARLARPSLITVDLDGRPRAVSIMRGDRSTATTLSHRSARRRVNAPVPHPTSRTSPKR